MNEIKIVITIKGHMNESIKGLSCTDFEIEGHRVIMCTEEPAGKYTLYYNKKENSSNKKNKLELIKYIKTQSQLFEDLEKAHNN